MPGPKPFYQPKFRSEQVEEARKIAARLTAPYREVQRAKLLLLLNEDRQVRSPEAARRLGMNEFWVLKWRRRWCRKEVSLKDEPRPGGNRRFSPQTDRADQGRRLRAALPA